jgi:O-antigen ligase
MKNIDIIQDSPENKISYYHLAAFVVSLPFDRFYSELVLISLLLHAVIHCNRTRFRSLFTTENLILASVFLVNLAGTLYSDDKKEAVKDLERQAAIVLFPVVFSLLGLNLARYRKTILQWLGYTCVITILYLYTDAIRIILYNHLPVKTLFSRAFINHNFTEPIGLHATYFSMYVALSLALFLQLLLEEKKKNFQFLYLIVPGVLLAGLLQLASRSVLIATILLVIPGFAFLIATRKQRVKFLITAILLLLVTLFGITKIDSFKKRYIGDFKNDLTQASINNELLEPRITRWHYALELVKQSPVIGYGSGSEKRLLKETYFRNKLYNSYLNELNAHNQYLSFSLKTGIVGLAIFLVTLFYGFRKSWRNKDIILAAFMILVTVVSFSENILDVNKGIFFYAFFLSFLVKSSLPYASGPVKEKIDGI